MFKRNCPKCNKELAYKKEKVRDDLVAYGATCKSCRPTRAKRIKDETFFKERSEYQRKYRLENFEYLKLSKSARLNRIKLEGITHYGGKCSCCGETILEFLTLEHKAGRADDDYRGADKKRKVTGKRAWEKARREGWPDKYTVLCFNCNCAKGIYGKCPHQNQ